jgi:hypothetical protein
MTHTKDEALLAAREFIDSVKVHPTQIAARDAIHAAIEQALATPVQSAERGEPVAQAWDEGYRAGIDDERTSEANIGIAGFDAKVEPARNNPYRTTPPAAQRTLVWLSQDDEREIKDRCTTVACVLRAVKAKLKDKNT